MDGGKGEEQPQSVDEFLKGTGEPVGLECAEDERATQESIKFANKVDLDEDGQTREHVRHQMFRSNLNNAALFLFWVLVVCIACATAVVAWHFLAPRSWGWLDSDQLDKVQTFLLTALFSSALTGYVNKRMD